MIEQPDSPLVHELYPSPNFGPRRAGARPHLLVLHYTGMASAARALDWLSRPESQVSCHYVAAEDGRIVQMVAEDKRAWHAGRSFWAGESDINSCSIGIEIHNPGHGLGYPDFPAAQMEAVVALAADIVRRWNMAPWDVLAHSDVAPERKSDPGEKFNWALLAGAGAGLWVPPLPLEEDDHSKNYHATDMELRQAQMLLRAYGYDAPLSGRPDEKTQCVLRAFQRHFRPARVDGRLDLSTLATLEALVARTGKRV